MVDGVSVTVRLKTSSKRIRRREVSRQGSSDSSVGGRGDKKSEGTGGTCGILEEGRQLGEAEFNVW